MLFTILGILFIWIIPILGCFFNIDKVAFSVFRFLLVMVSSIIGAGFLIVISQIHSWATMYINDCTCYGLVFYTLISLLEPMLLIGTWILFGHLVSKTNNLFRVFMIKKTDVTLCYVFSLINGIVLAILFNNRNNILPNELVGIVVCVLISSYNSIDVYLSNKPKPVRESFQIKIRSLKRIKYNFPTLNICLLCTGIFFASRLLLGDENQIYNELMFFIEGTIIGSLIFLIFFYVGRNRSNSLSKRMQNRISRNSIILNQDLTLFPKKE